MVMAALRDLELRHLSALDAVATEGTFGRAAVRLGYTQSAVSQQIASLERLVGGSLFDRPGGPRPVELTPPIRVSSSIGVSDEGASLIAHSDGARHSDEGQAETTRSTRLVNVSAFVGGSACSSGAPSAGRK